jgi:DNA modification methylase
MARRNWYRFDYVGRMDSASLSPSSSNGKGVPKTPFREAVSAGKGGTAYNAHSYPTKIPPDAIEPFIRYYTRPGDVVLDPFCGSGMTGVAAVRTGRRAVLNDLSTLAMHLAYNHCSPCDPEALRVAWGELKNRLRPVIEELYGTQCGGCANPAFIRYTIWSDVYGCPECGAEVPLWKHGLNRSTGTVQRRLSCPGCNAQWLKSAERRIRVEPAWVGYSCECSRRLMQQELTQEEQVELSAFPPPPPDMFIPKARVGADREMYRRSALHLQGISSVADFYTSRNLLALAHLWDRIGRVTDKRIRLALSFAFTNTAWHGTRMRRFNAKGGHRPLTGTLYIPQLSSEANVFDVFENKIAHLVRFYSETSPPPGDVHLNLGSATNLGWVADDSVDYIFTDPPFGSNIFYADCNLICEAWLGQPTDDCLEAVVNRSRPRSRGGKTLAEYGGLLTAAFAEMYRVLKPGHWATIVFQSSDGDVWRTVETAAADAGFEVHDANVLDKIQQSMKGYKGRNGSENVASFDLVLHLRKVKHQAYAPTIIALDQMEEHVSQVVAKHLRQLSSRRKRERTIQFLYSFAVRSLLNVRSSASGLTMESFRTVLERHFTVRDGVWYVTRGKGEGRLGSRGRQEQREPERTVSRSPQSGGGRK